MALPLPRFRTAAQAAALAEVIELEAKWQNLPMAVMTNSAAATRAAQLAKQAAYDKLHTKAKVYNKQFRPAFIGLQKVATPERLAKWCRETAELLRRAGTKTCPIELVEWTRRWADRVADRRGRDPRDLDAVTTTDDAIAELEAICGWCGDLVSPTVSSVAA
ncbi:MAG TPA: hypothetical protein VH120_18260 [Gemmataceae bacterium]|nr:hypothetical protein [Gemmataceae bacterium]